VHFAFSDEQLELRDAVRDLLAKECPPARVREAWTNADGRSGAWAALAAMGVPGMLAPESAGGLGCDEVDVVLLLEETGRVCLPEPVVETAMVAVPLLDGDPRRERLVAGPATAAAVAPTDEFAVWADSACLVVVFDEGGVHAVDRDAVRLEARPSVDGSRRLSWVDADLSTATLVGGPDDAARAFDRGVVGVAAQLLGLARRMLDQTVEYAREREQFGVPIGSFQAVKHHLANARLRIEFAAPLVYRAAWSLAHPGPHTPIHASMAKATASDAAEQCARVALQCHGAIGYTTEYDLHLSMKRSWALARSWGDARWHRRRVADGVLDPRANLLEPNSI
jgi:alkylation response protein AidB-like acyl-CoA dehydrogenase